MRKKEGGSWFAVPSADHHGGPGLEASLEAAGHIASPVRSQREMDAGVQLALSLFSPEPQLRGWSAPHSRGALPFQRISANALKGTPRAESPRGGVLSKNQVDN